MTLIVTIGGAGLGMVFDVERPAGPGETAFADVVGTISGGKASSQATGGAGSRISRGRGSVEALDERHGSEVPVRMAA